jgi:putative colanic acid biosynthesis UDP-glucose lipid carrier transferase
MLNKKSQQTLFFHAPQPISAFIAALTEPTIAVLTLLAIYQLFGQDIARQDIVLGLFVCALSFPGRNRFRAPPLATITGILFSWSTTLAVLTLLGYATKTIQYFRIDILSTWGLITPLAQWLAVTLVKQWVQALGSDPDQRRKAIVVGAAYLGSRVAKSINSHHEFGTDFLGYFDDRMDSRIPTERTQQTLGRLKDVAAYVRANKVSDVFITLPLTSQSRILTLLQELQDTTASMYYVPDVFGISMIQGRMRDVSGIPVVGLRESPIVGINAAMKRALDVIVAMTACVVGLPLFAFIALGVWLTSPGPIIQRLRRFGHNGQEIIVYQFRTATAPGIDSRKWANPSLSGSGRTTAFGQMLRRTSLEALPQLLNVLQGRLSIVGPHLLTVTAGEQYRKMISGYMIRYMVKPGLTGLAQVNGCSEESDTESLRARMVYDLEYLRNWSVMLDLSIMGRAIRKISQNFFTIKNP